MIRLCLALACNQALLLLFGRCSDLPSGLLTFFILVIRVDNYPPLRLVFGDIPLLLLFLLVLS